MEVTESQRAFEIQVESRLETVLNYQKTLEKVCRPFVHQGRATLLNRIRLRVSVQVTDCGTKALFKKKMYWDIDYRSCRLEKEPFPDFHIKKKTCPFHLVQILHSDQLSSVQSTALA